MIISSGLSRAYEFACHSASCRPPASGGTGGSKSGGSGKSLFGTKSEASLRSLNKATGQNAGAKSSGGDRYSKGLAEHNAKRAEQDRVAKLNKEVDSRPKNPKYDEQIRKSVDAEAVRARQSLAKYNGPKDVKILGMSNIQLLKVIKSGKGTADHVKELASRREKGVMVHNTKKDSPGVAGARTKMEAARRRAKLAAT